LSRRRAARVSSYLVDRFQLRPAYLGVIPTGAEPVDDGTNGGFKEGVGIVSFYK